MSKDWTKKFSEWFNDNRSYKLIALVITVALWLTILGRRDVVVSRDFNVEYLLKPNHVLATEVIRQVRIKVSGPRTALKKFSSSDDTVTLDLQDYPIGHQTVEVRTETLSLPLGVKVLSITPNVIKVRIKQNSGG